MGTLTVYRLVVLETTIYLFCHRHRERASLDTLPRMCFTKRREGDWDGGLEVVGRHGVSWEGPDGRE